MQSYVVFLCTDLSGHVVWIRSLLPWTKSTVFFRFWQQLHGHSLSSAPCICVRHRRALWTGQGSCGAEFSGWMTRSVSLWYCSYLISLWYCSWKETAAAGVHTLGHRNRSIAVYAKVWFCNVYIPCAEHLTSCPLHHPGSLRRQQSPWWLTTLIRDHPYFSGFCCCCCFAYKTLSPWYFNDYKLTPRTIPLLGPLLLFFLRWS